MANPIDKYRNTHRRLRKLLQPYTDKLCPVCEAPCCRKPTRVSEFDVLLANACGCSLPSANDSASELLDAGMSILMGTHEEAEDLPPCDYLNPTGCAFPDDLRPFECTRYICTPLKQEVTAADMREIRDLLHKLGIQHRELLDAIAPKVKRGR